VILQCPPHSRPDSLNENCLTCLYVRTWWMRTGIYIYIYIYLNKFSHRIYIRFSSSQRQLLQLLFFIFYIFYALLLATFYNAFFFSVLWFSINSEHSKEILALVRILFFRTVQLWWNSKWWNPFKASLNISKKTEILWLLFSHGVAAFLPLLLPLLHGEVIKVLIN
jgi:hypothetical protein